MDYFQQSWSGHRQFILLPVQVAGKAVTGAEKTKGTKPIGKINLTPVTLSLCNWRNLNWISLTERCWHWEIAQTWEALAGHGKCWGEKNWKKLPHLFINVSPSVRLPHFSLSQGDNVPPPTLRQPIWSLIAVHWEGLQFFSHVYFIEPDNTLSTHPLISQENTVHFIQLNRLKAN